MEEYKSFKVEIRAKGESSFVANGIRLPDEAQAKRYASDLWSRMTVIEEWRVTPSTDPINHTADEYGRLTQYSEALPTSDLCRRVTENNAEDIDSDVANQICKRLKALAGLIAEIKYINETVTGEPDAFSLQVMEALTLAENVVDHNFDLPRKWS